MVKFEERRRKDIFTDTYSIDKAKANEERKKERNPPTTNGTNQSIPQPTNQPTHQPVVCPRSG